MMDAVAVATGTTKEKFKDLPVGMRAAEVPDGMVAGNDSSGCLGDRAASPHANVNGAATLVSRMR